jgi:hypothetical protein
MSSPRTATSSRAFRITFSLRVVGPHRDPFRGQSRSGVKGQLQSDKRGRQMRMTWMPTNATPNVPPLNNS